MIPNLPATNDEDTGIKHMTCAEMNRGRDVFEDRLAQFLEHLPIQCELHGKDIIGDYIRKRWKMLRYAQKHSYTEIKNGWLAITTKGKQALENYRKRTQTTHSAYSSDLPGERG
jgi:hypothetical protein